MAANGPNSAPLGVNLPTMLSGLDTQYSAENFIASDAIAQGIGLHKPDVDPELVRRYGRDDLSGLLSMVPGYTKGIKNSIEYYHGEKDFIHGLVQVGADTTGGATTEAGVTLASNSQGAVPWYNEPYFEGTPPTNIPTAVPQVYDVLQLPGRFEVVVTAVDKAAGTMDIASVTGDDLPVILTTDQLIIKGSSQPEASRAGESRTSRLLSYKNNMFIHRRDHKVTGTEMGEQTWMTFKGKGGKKGNVWYLEALYDEYQRFKNELEMMHFDGKQIGNGDLTTMVGFETLTKTEGLITTIETAGNNRVYIAGGLLLADLTYMNRQLNKFKGDTKNLLMCGFNFREDMNKLWRTGDGIQSSPPASTTPAPGRLKFGKGGGIENISINLDFERVTLNGFTYFIKQTNAFSDPTTLGAIGQGYEDFGIVIPMGSTVTYNDLSDQNSSEQVKSIRMNYKIEKAGISRAYKEWVTGGAGGYKTSDEDAMTVHQLAQCGLEVFAANRFGLFKTSA